MAPVTLSAQAGVSSVRSLPQLGDGDDMSLAAEKKLGLRIARELYRDPDYIDDPVLGDYVQSIWQPLLAAARQRGDITPEMSREFAWALLLGKDKSINAFALPGGYFGLHLGLISVVASRDELASVLAHEITHVAQRHIARSQAKQAQQAPWILAAMILGSVAASKNSNAAGAVLTGAQAVGIQSQLNYSRDMEREADRIGYALSQDAGFDVQGFVGMFDKLQQASRINDNGSFPYLRSHPLTIERLGDMQARLQLEPPSVAKTSVSEHAEHLLMAARARVLAEPATPNLRGEVSLAEVAMPHVSSGTLPTQLKAMTQLYAGAVAALRLREAATALRLADAALGVSASLHRFATADLRQKSPVAVENTAQLAIELVALEALLAQTPVSTSALTQRLERVQQLSAGRAQAWSRSVLLLRAQAAVAAPQAVLAEPVLEALHKHVSQTDPSDALAWTSLSQLYSLQQLPLRSLRAQAESRMALLDYSGALDRLKAAQDLAKTQGAHHIEASILDTRTRQVQAVLREMQLDK